MMSYLYLFLTIILIGVELPAFGQASAEWRAYSAIYSAPFNSNKRSYGLYTYDHEIWFLQNSGISRYNPSTQAQQLYHTYEITNSMGTVQAPFGSSNSFRSIISDLAQDTSGALWTCTQNALYKLENEQWKSIPLPDSVRLAPVPSGAPFSTFNQFLDLEFDQNNVLWIAAWAQVWSYDGQNWRSYDYTNYGMDPAQYLTIDQNNTVWVTSFLGELASFDGGTWTHYLLSNYNIGLDYALSRPYVDDNNTKWFPLYCNGAISSCADSLLFLTYNDTTWEVISSSDIGTTHFGSFLLRGRNGSLWSNSSSGLLEYDGSNWIEHNLGRGMPFFDIDASGLLWGNDGISTFSYNGAIKDYFNVGLNSFRYYNNLRRVARDLSSSGASRMWWVNNGRVGNIHFDSSKVTLLDPLIAYEFSANSTPRLDKIVAHSNTDIWIAQSDTTGIWQYDGANLTFIPLDTQLAPYNTRVEDMVVDNNEVWLATAGAGLLHWNGSSWQGNFPAPLDGSLQQVLRLPSGEFWLSQGNQLFYYDNLAVTTYDFSNSNLPNAAIKDLYYNSTDSSLWLTTDTAGLVHYHRGVWTTYTTQNSDIASNFLTKVTQDALGNTWIGSRDSGLIQLDAVGQFSTVNIDNNALSLDNEVFSIAVDEHNNVWHLKGDQLLVYQEGGLVNVEQFPTIPTLIASHSYPNPFSQSSTIQYTLPQATTVSVSVYNLQGQLVELLLQKQFQAAGEQQVTWQPSQQLPTGLYFYHIFAEGQLLGQGRIIYQQ